MKQKFRRREGGGGGTRMSEEQKVVKVRYCLAASRSQQGEKLMV
jgi:hypothetical protein